MMHYRRLLLSLILITCTTTILAAPQDTGIIPRNMKLDQRWSYNRYTHLVIPSINWLQNTPLDSNNNLRTRHDNFVMYWLQKNEQVVVHMPDYLLRFQNANRELYFIYAGGWIKHALETGDTTRKGNAIAGVKSVLDYYGRDMGIAPNDYLDDLLKLEQAGKLPLLFDSSDQADNTYLFLKPPADKHDFKPNENYFSFQYTGINFTDTKSLRYRYKLEGYYDKWIDTREETATFPNLPPGDYKFRVQASIHPGFAHAVEDSYSFHIATPFYKQTWFIIAFILLCLILAYMYMRWREKQLQEIADLKHDRVVFEYEYLKSQVNPHFLFNSLNTLTNLIEESPRSAVTYTVHLSDLYRNMLAFPDRNLVYLSEELEVLEDYVHIQKSRFGDALQLIYDIPEHFKNDKRIVYLALQLLVENAIKHNVVSKANPLVINISANEHELTVSNPLQAKMSKEKSNSMGLANISKRYALATDRKVYFGEENGLFVVRLPLL